MNYELKKNLIVYSNKSMNKKSHRIFTQKYELKIEL